jgi:predicted RNA polymerase sigma factor
LPLVDVIQEFHQAHDELLAALELWPADAVPLGPACWDETARIWWLTDHDREHLASINVYRQRLSLTEGD